MARLTPDSPPARRAPVVARRLAREYPDARCSLFFGNAWELLVATVLSAQCTDERVNSVTPALFARWPCPAELLGASVEEVEEAIRPTGFFRNKARSIRGAAAYLLDEHDGAPPRTTAALVRVPGVGRKTAAVVLGAAYGIAEGIAVDTHVGRLSRRLELIAESDPVAVERELMQIVPRGRWIAWTHLLIDHGRAVCQARTPRCDACVLLDICPEGRRRLGRTGAVRRARRAIPAPDDG